jgi:hypothetical protein
MIEFKKKRKKKKKKYIIKHNYQILFNLLFFQILFLVVNKWIQSPPRGELASKYII